MAHIKICIEEEVMSSITGSFTINVKAGGPPPPPNPVVITPASGALPDETEGVPVTDKVAVVSGGVGPYTYAITGLPAGVTATETPNADGTSQVALSGTPAVGAAAGSPYTVSVVVTDSAPAASPGAARATRTLNVR